MMPKSTRVSFATGDGIDDQITDGLVTRTISSESGSGSNKSANLAKESRFKDKHSLDSDEEEDNQEKYNVLHEDDIEGQEDTAVDIVDGITFTPFNMKEELEEGHFDNQGTYIFSSEKNAIQDNWIENIDWVRVKERSKKMPAPPVDDDSEDDTPPPSIDTSAIYHKMIELMKPGENVLKAIRRLGGATSASQRWKAKQAKTTNKESTETDKAGMLKLTELADSMLQAGNFDMYEHTYEKLSFLLSTEIAAQEAKKPVIPEGMADDDALDMFADDLDKKESTSDAAAAAAASAAKDDTADQVHWEYKWIEGDTDEIHGPYSSAQMLQWTEQKFFEAGILVRKVDSDGDFYKSDRIDFDLYT